MIEPTGSVTEAPPEAGPEAGPECGPEAGPETGVEAGPETGVETGVESGPEYGVETGAETGAEAGPENVVCVEIEPKGPTGYLVEVGVEYAVEGIAVEAGVENFAQVAAGVEVETFGGGVEEISAGSHIEIEPSAHVEVVPGGILETLPGSEVQVIPWTTTEVGPEQFDVEIVPGSLIEVEGGILMEMAPGSKVEIAAESMVETISGAEVEIGPAQCVELLRGDVESFNEATVEAPAGIEVAANYVQIEAAPNSEVNAEFGSEVEIVTATGGEAEEEIMPGTEVEVASWAELEVVPNSLELIEGGFSLEVISGSEFEAATGSTATSDTETYVEVAAGSEAEADDDNMTMLWAGTLVTAQAYWTKLTANAVAGKDMVSYFSGMGPGTKEAAFGKSIEAFGTGGISNKLTAGFSSSTGQFHNIAVYDEQKGSFCHGQSGCYHVWQLIVEFQNDSGGGIVQYIDPSVVPFILA